MSELYLLTSVTEPPAEILPALGLLLHVVRTGPAEVGALTDITGADAVLVDARRDLVQARELCRLLRRVGTEVPVFAIMTEGGLAAITAEWGADDVLLQTAGPAEVEARLRLGPPERLFQTGLRNTEGRDYDVAAGGRFLFNVPSSEPPAVPITVILNWPEILAARRAGS